MKDADRIRQLRAQITAAEKAYHEDDAPIMTDSDYDNLLSELQQLEKQEETDNIAESSPTQRVGGRAKYMTLFSV